MKKFLTILLIALCAFACKSKKENVAAPTPPTPPAVEVVETQPAEDSTLLTYQRTPCFGMCPVFNLIIYKSGKAIYEGKNFTDMMGFYQSQMDATTLQRIYFVADSIGYFSLQDKYDNDKVTDLPTVKTALLKNGEMKQVANRYKGPKSLQALYNELNATIAKASWKPKNNK